MEFVVTTIAAQELLDIAVGASPTGVAVRADGLRVYVANTADNTISVINTNLGGVVATISLSFSPGGVAISPNGQSLYVTNTSGNVVAILRTPSV